MAIKLTFGIAACAAFAAYFASKCHSDADDCDDTSDINSPLFTDADD